MSYEIDRKPEEEPSLAEMTKKAIEILQKNKKGYFLLVEGRSFFTNIFAGIKPDKNELTF